MKNLFILIFVFIGLNLFSQNNLIHFGLPNAKPEMQPQRQVADNGLSDITVTYEFGAANILTQEVVTKKGKSSLFSI